MRRLALAAVVSCLLTTPCARQARDEVAQPREARLSLEERLQRLVPTPTEPGEARTTLERTARESGLHLALGAFSAPERLRLSDGRAAPVEFLRVEASGHGQFGPLLRFLSTVGHAGRVVQLEALRVTARGNDPKGCTVRLEGAALAGAFGVLSRLTGESFVLDHDLRGHVSLTAEGATLDEILSAMRAAGIVVGPPPLRRVVRTGPAPRTPSAEFTGERVVLELESTDLANLLCTISRGFSLEFAVPRGLKRRVGFGADR